MARVGADGRVNKVSDPIGRLEGLYEMPDGSLLVTDWNWGAIFQWTPKTGIQRLVEDFKGPADFCVIAQAGGLTVYLPDLPQSQIRIIQLRK